MQFKSFHWLIHQDIRAIVSCFINIVSVRVMFGSAFIFILFQFLAHSLRHMTQWDEYRWGRDVARKLLIVDGNDNFRRLPSPLVNGKLPLRNLKYTCAKIL